jgi:hypothetical protein
MVSSIKESPMKNMSQWVCALALLGSTPAFAHDNDAKGKPHPPVSKEDREKMAAVHEKMAACLRSDKGVDQCHEEMHTAMKNSGAECPMMAEHGKGHGHRMDSKDQKGAKATGD